MDDLERLVAIEEIKQLKARYFRCMDTKDWEGFAEVFAPDAVEAIRSTLRQSVTETVRGQRQAREQSLCYPLAINNLVTRAMNEAVKIGAPQVNAALIQAAVRGN